MPRINFDFDFSKNWKDRDDFPTKEYSEKRIREDIQLLFDELKAHCNRDLHPAINELYSKVAALGGGGQVEHDVMADNSIDSNNIVDNAVTETKIADGSVTTEKLAPSVSDDIASEVRDELTSLSSKITLLDAGSYQLYSPATAADIPSKKSHVLVRNSYSSLGVPSSTPMNRFIINCWTTPGSGVGGDLSGAPRHFKYAYGRESVGNLDIHLESTYDVDPSSEEFVSGYNFYAHYAIYLIEE